MTKKQVLATLALSTLTLAQAGLVSADETTTSTIEPSVPTEDVVVTVEPSEAALPVENTTPIEEPSETTITPVDPTPSVPVDPTEPSTPGTNEPVVPSDPVVTDPSTPPTTEEPQTTEEPTPSIPEPVTPTPSDNPSDGNGQTTQEPTPSTPQAQDPQTINPIPEPIVTFDPFVTPIGQTVIGTQNSQVIVQNADGSTQTLSAEAMGGVTNADGTVTLTAASGEVKTLPKTGEETTGLLSVLGASLLGLSGYLFKKKSS